jgi:D,D-heptose 1,7-bisphosphate phosphatase
MNGVYSRIGRPIGRSGALRPAVFLDRDGVITEDTHYLHRPEDVRFVPGALEAIAKINQLGFPVVLVTNQAGIGRGYYGLDDFELVQRYIDRELANVGGWFDGVWACAYHPDGVADARANHYRKPNPGMLQDAAAQLALDLRQSWLVGDKPCDIAAAMNAGLRVAIHVLTGCGHETRDEVYRLVREDCPPCEVHFCDSVQDLVPLLKASRPKRQLS